MIRAMKTRKLLIFLGLFLIIFTSCSTTRVLEEGEFRLKQNQIEITNDKSFKASQLNKYLKQNRGLGWSPLMNIYNWSNGNGGKWDKFVQKIGIAPVVYDADMVDSSVENILGHLEYLGYYGSKVETEINVNRKKVSVKYNVALGKRFPITEIKYQFPKRGEFTESFLKDSLNISVKKGDFLSESALEQETVRAEAQMKNLGFYSFSKNNFFFEADTLSRPSEAILEMSIKEYTRNQLQSDAVPIRKFYIGDVSFSYPKSLKINTNILKNLNTIVPGEVYRQDEINRTYSRLSALKVFSSVNVITNQSDTNKVDCTISLAQSKLQGFKTNLETSINSTGLFGISPQLSYYHKNIFGGGELFNMSLMGNFQFKFDDKIHSNEFGVSAGLSLPRFFPLPYRLFQGAIPRTDINLSYNYQSRPEYTRNIISTSFGYTGNISNYLYYQIYPIQLNVVRIDNMEDDFFASLVNDPYLWNAYIDHFDLGSGATLYYTTNAATIPQESYFYTRFQVDIAGNMLSLFDPILKNDDSGSKLVWGTPYSQFARAELTLGKTWVWGRNNGQALATRFLVGVGHAYGNSYSMPYEKQFYGGGANSLRGWQARSVGPGTSKMIDFFIIPNQTGDAKLEFNLEYRFDMFWKVEGAAFVDAGNVWTIETQKDLLAYDDGSALRWNRFGRSLAADWGMGVRLNLDFILLRLDLGMKVHDPSREDPWIRPGQWLKRDNFAVHFGVGYPF